MQYRRSLLPVCLVILVTCQGEFGVAQTPAQGDSNGQEEASHRLHEGPPDETSGEPDRESTGSWVAVIWHGAVSVWNYEITAVDDRPITAGTVITSIILLLIGVLASRLLSRVLGQRVLPRLGMHRSAATAIQSLTFYALVATFTLWALRFVNVPLTMFTFLGGAIAIGVGFGNQNIVNNFISGLILLAERPVRTGDLIQLGDLFGTVEHIGARSTRITTAANLEIIVPNSTFLENNVVNWTLANNMIRTSICVGVVYGSPTRMVTRLLKRAADEHGLILDNPEPFVWFTDFGDNSLNFELHFYIQIRNMMERRRVESDIRYKINELLNEAGITIAFPQRDVHLDTAQPLKVQVTPADRGEAEPPDDSGEAA